MRHFSVCCLISLFIFLPVSFVVAQNRGELELIASNGEVVGTFSQGYALVIGEINYNPDWDQLKSIENDIVIVKNLLEEQNFIVETLKDKTSDELKRGIENFLNTYGVDENARLVVFFAGHGATHPIQGRDIGYIVPIDAPTYKNNQREFIRKAIPIEDFQHWANRLPCRHILFIFDSCFSGTIFTTRSASEDPPDISYSMAKPVRQFITTGDEKEKVPAESKMIPLLERALRDGEADKNEDGYTTGTELGMYLQREIIIRHQGQWHPQYGKSHDTRWDKGDFVFKVGKRNAPRPPVTPSSSSGSQSSVAVGSVMVESDVAGEILIDGIPSGTIKAGGTVTITNVSTGNTEVAVKESDGNVIKAPVFMLRQGQTVTALIERPVPDGLYFEIIDGKSVTISGYSGNAATVYIPERIQGLPVTRIKHSLSFSKNQLSVIIPSSVTWIDEFAFSNQYGSLTSINVDNRNPAYASIDGVLFDKNIKTIIQYPAGKKAETYAIPSSVTNINRYSFSHCSNLTSITIPSLVTTIGDSAFAYCSRLISIDIPSSVINIVKNGGHSAFNYCISLASITVDSRNPAYISIDGVLFDKNIKNIIQYPAGKKGETYSIPTSVTAIGNDAFSQSSLTNVIIPPSVTVIGSDAFNGSGLTNVNIPSSVTSIGSFAFHGCSNLTSVTIPSSVTSIVHSMFSYCESLTNITIPSSVTTINAYAFYACMSLTTVNIPSSVTSIGDRAFGACYSLTSVNIPSSVTSIGDRAFGENFRLTSVTMSRRTQVESNTFPDTTRIIYRD